MGAYGREGGAHGRLGDGWRTADVAPSAPHLPWSGQHDRQGLGGHEELPSADVPPDEERVRPAGC